jgi:hypothetical protein
MLEHGAKTPAGGSITLHLVGPIHTPMTGEEASLLGVLARTCSQEPICSRARKNLSLPGRSITPHRGLYPWLLTMTTHVLLHSAHRRTTLAARSRLHRRRTWTASHQALGGGAQGPGFDNTIVGTLQTAMQTATRLRRHHPVHSTRRRPAAGSGRLHCCCAREGLAGSEYTIFFSLRAAVRQPDPAGCRTAVRGDSPASTTPSAALCSAWGSAGFDDNIFCTLLAAVRQPASAGCRAAAPWGFLLRRHHVVSSAGSCPAFGFGWLSPPTALWGCPPLHYMPPPSKPLNWITTSHTCSIHLMGPTPTPVALSGESIHSPVWPLSFFLRP